jgi:Cyanobacterial TRADD-N associated 2-Transmembrane domain
MLASMAYCGAIMRSGAHCRNRVQFPWQHCHLHRNLTYRPYASLIVLAATVVIVTYLISAGLGAPAFSLLGGLEIFLGICVAIWGGMQAGRSIRFWSRRKISLQERELAQTLGVKPLSEPDDEDSGGKNNGCDDGDREDENLKEPSLASLDGKVETGERLVDRHPELEVSGYDELSRLTRKTSQYSDGKARMVIKYYNQGHRQASVSFILSMTFAILGFIVVAVAAIGYIRNPDQLGTTVVTGIVGAINEVVSFLFFQRADKGRELMMGLVDRLRDDREKERQFAAAIGTIGQVENSGVRDALRAAVTLQFSGASTKFSDITTLAESDTFLKMAHSPSKAPVSQPPINGTGHVPRD